MATASRKTTLALPCMTGYLELGGFSGEKQSIFSMNAEGLTLIGIRGKLPNFKNRFIGTFLVVQGLRCQAPSAEGPGSIPDWGTGSLIQQLSGLHAATKDLVQPNKYFLNK